MAKKSKPPRPPQKDFSSNPFKTLKGFAVSGSSAEEMAEKTPAAEEGCLAAEESPRSFADEMTRLGVQPLHPEAAASGLDEQQPEAPGATKVPVDEEQEFLQAMGELEVTFNDQLPEEDVPPVASPRRLKQLKQGRLKPEATLDLHGLQRADVVSRLQFFLQDAVHQEWRTLLVITGRGRHSIDGEPVLRSEAEAFLSGEGRKWVAEWCRAPKQYGGTGALVLFLRKLPR